MAFAIRLRSNSSRLTKNLLCPGVLFIGILSLKARLVVLFGVVDAVVELSNIFVLIVSALSVFCFFLNLKLGQEEKPSNFKLSISSFRNK